MKKDIVSTYVREQKRYTKNDLKKLFSFDELGVEKFIKRLKAYGVLKSVRNDQNQLEMSDLINEDIEITDEKAESGDCLYVFTYVGVIVCGNRIVKSIPKYLQSDNVDLHNIMKQILDVIEKYSRTEEQIINVFNGSEENRSFNVLAVILFLLNDYFEHGLYNNREEVIEVNGVGEILWQKTIDDSLAIIKNERPYYVEMFTKKSVNDENDYFRRLHECVLAECFYQLHNAELDSLFGVETIDLFDETLDVFGDRDFILEQLNKEINIQFNTRKQILLKTLYAYISQEKKVSEGYSGISMYGTNSFYAIWEKVCAEVFDNKLNTPLNQLNLSMPLAEKYKDKQRSKLIDIIEKPIWETKDVRKASSDTLIPDIISIYKSHNKDCFIIFDAKYYNIQLEKDKSLRGNPGIGDITKQYLYQLAYREFTESHSINAIKNCFLMPTEKEIVVDKGVVKLPMLENLGLVNIQVRLIPAKEVFDCYLNKRIFDISKLKL